MIALIKPQFEAGKGRVGKGGIVRETALHADVCERVGAFLVGAGWTVLGLTDSPIIGADGSR